MKRLRKPAAPSGRQRRNTTDWQRPAAFSYHAQRAERAQDDSQRQPQNLVSQRRRLLTRQFWLRRGSPLAGIVLAVLVLLLLAGLSTKPRIVLVGPTGDQTFHRPADYQQAAHDYLGGSLLNRSKITVNTAAAAKDLQRRYPELESVAISLPLIGWQPTYYVQANPPAFTVQATNGNYILDASGKALLAAAASPAISNRLPVITDQSGNRVQIGKQVISSQEAAFIRTVITTLAGKQVTVSTIILPAATVGEVDMQLAGQPFIVKFNSRDDTARQQAGTYLATIANLADQGITPAQYVDVRVSGRAYYL